MSPAASAPRRLLVLGGGGSTGAYQAGCVLALAEHGLHPDALCGCSVGSLNAAYLATGPSLDRAGSLAEWWATGHGQRVLAPSRWGSVRVAASGVRQRRGSVLDPRPLRELVAQHVGARDVQDLPVPLTVTTTCLDCAAARHHDRGPLVDLLMASCALPGLLPAVPLPDGHRHVDGGVVCGVPLAAAMRAAGPHDEVLVLDCGLAPVTGTGGRCAVLPDAADCCGLGPVRTPWPTAPPVGRRAVDVALRSFTVARAVANRAAVRRHLDDPRVRVLPHVPDAHAAGVLRALPSGPRDFSATGPLLAAGLEATRRWLAAA